VAAIYFTLAGIALYLAADWLLERIELRRGERLEHRTLVFFGILLGLALVTFPLLQRLLEWFEQTGSLDIGQGYEARNPAYITGLSSIRPFAISVRTEREEGSPMPESEEGRPVEDDGRVPFMQGLLDNPFLLLFLGVVVPTIFYMIWGIMEIVQIPVAP